MAKAVKLHVEHVHIDRQGYDKRGRYWGVGGKLYRVYDDSGLIDKHVRAKDAKEARLAALLTSVPAWRG